ncbi:MAG: alpha/beta fold hydrolase [Rhodococcus sp. (in: high G+C Gram-positive bacteria)]
MTSAPNPRLASPTETELARIWSEVLGVAPISPTDTFTDLGGGSLAAESMLVATRASLPSALTAADLVGDPTLRQLAELLDKRHRDRFHSRASACVALREAVGADPVFCFAGAGSTSAYFLPLAAALREYSVYSLQAHGLENRALPAWSVAGSVRRHVREIRRIQPHGPYRLLGHSFGGVLALETARALTASGEDVAALILLDTVVDSEASLRAWNDRKVEQPEPKPAVDSSDDGDHSSGFVSRMATHARILAAGVVRYDLGTQKRVFWERAVRAQRRHHIAPWHGDATILLTVHTREQAQLWPHIVGGQLDCHDCAGDHMSMISDVEVIEVIESALHRSPR